MKLQLLLGGRDFHMKDTAPPLTREQLEQIARDNVEAHIGDVCPGEEDLEVLYEEAYSLALDAVHDVGIGWEEARSIAAKVAGGMFG